MGLVDQFNKINTSIGDSASYFRVEKVPDFPFAKIGVDPAGQAVLLIDYQQNERPIKRNFRLKYIELSHIRNYKVVESGQILTGNFILVLFRSRDAKLQAYFFSILETFLESLALTPVAEQSSCYENMIEIFRALNEDALSTVQGLWGELFVILHSKNPTAMISFWHSSPRELFDFNDGQEKLEVKSSKKSLRIHSFSSDQLSLEIGMRIIIASLFVIENESGESISSLTERMKIKVRDRPELIQKLMSVIAKTLGSSIEESITRKFDFSIANQSLRFYDGADVGKIDRADIPSRVSDVHFQSDLTNLIPIAFGHITNSASLHAQLN
jgi:hypothetical protein